MSARRQYAQIKARYPEHVLLFKTSPDRYETHMNDAYTCAEILGSTLHDTAGLGTADTAYIDEQDADKAIARLIHAGHKVALMEMIRAPRQEPIQDTPRVVVTKDGAQALLPTFTPPPFTTSKNTQQLTMF